MSRIIENNLEPQTTNHKQITLIQMNHKHILLGHGSGGKLAHELITQVFVKRFGKADAFLTDSAQLEINGQTLAYTTDSYVVDPIFFPGGNIGKLAVCGTVNDLAVSGATPLYLTSAFILEEGFPVEQLELIVEAMAAEAVKAGVKIMAGDTKVVTKGKCDKGFINTSGIGLLPEKYKHISFGSKCKEGDKIIINGPIAEHGVAIMAARNQVTFDPPVHSDCASLNHMIRKVLEVSDGIRFMRDATRGGLATVLCELASENSFGIEISEKHIPVSETVSGFCEVFGYDPLYIANEGKVVVLVDGSDAVAVLECLKADPLGSSADIIGTITSSHARQVVMKTTVGGNRMLDMLTGEQLPRIC
jgi:hydrogenase expression/formation protein HypE